MNVDALPARPEPIGRDAPGSPGAHRLSPTGLAVVLAVHAVVFYGLLQLNVIRLPVALPVLSVDLLVESPPEPLPSPRPEVTPPRPRQIEPRPAPRPVPQQPAPLAVPADAPVTPQTIEVPVPVPVAPEPAPAPVPTPPAAAAPTEPRFDADYLDNPKPTYPYASRRQKEEGRVVLRVQVAASGVPTQVVVHAGSGHERLDQAALETVRRWKFVPARRGSDPVAASVLVPIEFSLKN